MAAANFMRLILLALAFCVFSVHAAPARLVLRDSTTSTSTDNVNSTINESSTAVNSTEAPDIPSPHTSQCDLTEYKATHANPREPITLWMAVPNSVHRVAAIKSNKIPVRRNGDFGRGSYFADTKDSAAQMVCRGHKHKSVRVFAYDWDPTAMEGLTTYMFGSRNDQWRAFVYDRKEAVVGSDIDMIAGPIRRRHNVAPGVWQYVIRSQALKALELRGDSEVVRCRDISTRRC